MRTRYLRHIGLLIGLFCISMVFLFTTVLGMLYGRMSNASGAQVPTASVTHVRTVLTSAWSPPSPDPSGIAWWPAKGRLIVSDGEVDEMTIYAGANIYETGTNGSLKKTSTTLPYSNEPTGVAVNQANNHVFFSDDVKRMVFEIDPGPDGLLHTADDWRTSFSTRAFGSEDPEGLAYGQGTLFISDGFGSEIYRVNPGANGLFDGIAPSGDDQISQFDTASLGETDPEGVEFNPDTNTLFIVGHGNKRQMLEVNPDGSLKQSIDISVLAAKNPSGIASGPGSVNAGVRSFYIVDRGVDNDTDPSENDGKLYEISLGSSLPTPTADPNPGAVTLYPIADTYVRSDKPTVNFGSRNILNVDGNPPAVSYLKYDLAPLAGRTVSSAKLRFFIVTASTATQTVKSVSNASWAETTMIYTNRPALGSILTTFTSPTINAWVETDITAQVLVRQGRLMSLGIDETSANGMTFSTRETANKPTLIVNFR